MRQIPVRVAWLSDGLRLLLISFGDFCGRGSLIFQDSEMVTMSHAGRQAASQAARHAVDTEASMGMQGRT